MANVFNINYGAVDESMGQVNASKQRFEQAAQDIHTSYNTMFGSIVGEGAESAKEFSGYLNRANTSVAELTMQLNSILGQLSADSASADHFAAGVMGGR